MKRTKTIFTAFFILTAFSGFTANTLAQTDITNYKGAASAQYNEVPEQSIEKVIDNSSSTSYMTKHNSCWMQYLATGFYTVTKYTLTTGYEASNTDPKNWILKASNDGLNWKSLDVQSNQVFANRGQKNTYTIANSSAFQYYRLDVNNGTAGTASPNKLQIAEWEIFGTQITDTSTSKPAAPSNLTASQNSNAQIDLSWNDNSDNETYFRVERSLNGTTGWLYLTAAAPKSIRYSSKGLDSVTTYFYRVCAINSSGVSDYSNVAFAKTLSKIDPPLTWQEHWFEHCQLLHRVYMDDELVVYYDDNVAPSITWPFKFIGDVWKYTKKTYGEFSSDKRLFAVFHTGVYSGGHPATYFDDSHDNRNFIDVAPGPWLSGGAGNDLDLPTHEVGHIVEGAAHGVKGSPAFGLWGDSKWMEIYIYDVYLGLGRTADANRWYNLVINGSDNFPVAGSKWFKNWFFPIYNNYGKTKVLQNYFLLLSQYFPKSANEYTRDMNWGEFIHFWSGAAGVDLKEIAKKAFGWTTTTEAQYKQAQKDFPKITYSALSVKNDTAISVENYNLLQNYPNPFNPATNISYSLEKAGHVTLKIYNILGKEIKTLVNEIQNSGTYSYNFEAGDLSSGVYYYKLSAGGNFCQIKKMILIR